MHRSSRKRDNLHGHRPLCADVDEVVFRSPLIRTFAFSAPSGGSESLAREVRQFLTGLLCIVELTDIAGFQGCSIIRVFADALVE